MSHRNDEYEKRQEPVTFRTSERKACWLNDVARVRGIDRSFLVDEIVTEWLESGERVRTPEYRTREIADKLETAKAALEVAFERMHMLCATGGKLRKQRAS